MAAKKTLVTLAELHQNPAEAYKEDQLNLLLNQPPHERWLKAHPLAKVKNDQGQNVPARYLSIDKVEFLLTRIFGQWKVEILHSAVFFNSIAVTVRLHYRNPVNGVWMFHDGAGAMNVQRDAKAGLELGAPVEREIKDSGVQMAFPAAVSYAIKDAAEHLGTLFGRDVNRRNLVQFTGTFEAPPEEPSYKTGPAPTMLTAEDLNIKKPAATTAPVLTVAAEEQQAPPPSATPDVVEFEL